MLAPCWHEVFGHPEAPTVLFSSGLGGAGAFWRPQVPLLLERGYRVIIYDQRGTGRSAGPIPEDYSIRLMADDVEQILDITHTKQAFILGHALGGLVGLTLALCSPQRVAGLGLVNAWAKPNPHSARCFAARTALLETRGPIAYVEAQPIFLYPAYWCVDNHERLSLELEHALAHFPAVATVKARIAALLAFDVAAELEKIKCPVWVSAAQDDVLVPWTSSKFMVQHLSHAVFDLVPRGGHGHCVTESDLFNQQMIAFLDNQTESPPRVFAP